MNQSAQRPRAAFRLHQQQGHVHAAHARHLSIEPTNTPQSPERPETSPQRFAGWKVRAEGGWFTDLTGFC